MSATDQDLAIQVAALRSAGCQVIRSEKRTGNQREGRAELDLLGLRLHAEETLSRSAIAKRLGTARSGVSRFLPGAERGSSQPAGGT